MDLSRADSAEETERSAMSKLMRRGVTGLAFFPLLLCGGRPTVFVHLVNHLLQLLRCRVLAEHPHHLAQLLGADAAVLGVLHKDVEGGLELCTGKQFQLSVE